MSKSATLTRIHLPSGDPSLQYLDCTVAPVGSGAVLEIVNTGPGAGRAYWCQLLIWDEPIEGGVVVMNSRTFPKERSVVKYKIDRVEYITRGAES